MKQLIETLDQKFRSLHLSSREMVKLIPDDRLFWSIDASEKLFPVNSCGEFILRSAAKVEQTFNGLTTKLWDDPFEWTLPEHLSTGAKIIDYLEEVEIARKKGFDFFTSDSDLQREIPAPIKLTSLFSLLLDTLAYAENFQGRAIANFRLFSNEKLPR